MSDQRLVPEDDVRSLALWFVQFVHQHCNLHIQLNLFETAIADWLLQRTDDATSRALLTLLTVARENGYISSEEYLQIERQIQGKR